jgi:hypothetical protein
MSELRPTHPHCPICEVPTWLVRVELGDIADHQHFECMECDRKSARTMPAELRVLAGTHMPKRASHRWTAEDETELRDLVEKGFYLRRVALRLQHPE